MLYFTVLFLCIGVGLGLFGLEKQTVTICIGLISLVWFFVWGPWAIATFIELVIGYSVAMFLRKQLN